MAKSTVTKIKKNTDSSFFSLSQTPKNYDPKNYYKKTMQDKVNAEWPYRVNRIDVLYETDNGTNEFDPMEVVVQHVKSDTGVQISSDYLRLVFKDLGEDRFLPGHKFLFNPLLTRKVDDTHYIKAYYDQEKDKWTYIVAEVNAEGIIEEHEVDYIERQEVKSVRPGNNEPWLVINTDMVNLTSSVVVQRCNTTIGSVWTDENNVTHAHYEPVILTRDLSSTNFVYNKAAVNPQSGLLMIAQHNKYTEQYFTNQRFIVGYDEIYRIKAINKFYGNTAYNPYSDGLMNIYLEITDASPYDDWEKRLAYQKDGAKLPEVDVIDNPPVVPVEDQKSGESTDTVTPKETFLSFKEPNPLPNSLGNTQIKFVPQAVQDNKIVPIDEVEVNLSLGEENVDDYVNLQINEEDCSFSLNKKRTYLRNKLKVECVANVNGVKARKVIELSLAGI